MALLVQHRAQWMGYTSGYGIRAQITVQKPQNRGNISGHAPWWDFLFCFSYFQQCTRYAVRARLVKQTSFLLKLKSTRDVRKAKKHHQTKSCKPRARIKTQLSLGYPFHLHYLLLLHSLSLSSFICLYVSFYSFLCIQMDSFHFGSTSLDETNHEFACFTRTVPVYSGKLSNDYAI